ncbi:NAD-dependent epimerase/dehydratase family protein [Conexibacter sp. JD483]|uniref:NAD-dependent epimerase/dehydratase family protein n=1 Tax=unclassified Conexibacter TaxID=2627773 RepID=UPI00271B54BB|nr:MULTISPECIES: NAD-dependent epimerase/dehydratase family protein [unclassified Conexibacter]MDO8184193.1 NAD-dependent epimerase/dehydratase family protein [Conexibacter sp. CPCC 205706]MDO8197185.1 NAD-dependent epimerase/dehydratase family protein [Conexibacter sp. CPCC 205762]MDR9367500.1 NAD-dependent epimerase/dehydratase family protein [Conexibacter sp. JD483]
MATRRVLVTGAAGFVGAVLARRLLADGHRVTLAVRPGGDHWRLQGLDGDAELIALDLRDAAAVTQEVAAVRPDWVFSLAAHGAYSWQSDLATMADVNIKGTANLVAAAVDAGAVVVHAGSSSEYGYVDHAPREHELPHPNSAYAVTKCAATLHCGWVARERDAGVTVLRLYSAYGPWEEPRRLMPTLLAACARGELPPLTDPTTARDFVYVEDVADAFVRAASRARPGEGAVYNVGSGVQTSLGELVGVARELFDVAATPAWGGYGSRSWDTSTWVSDPSLARERLGWSASTSLREGLRRMAEADRAGAAT